MQSRFLALLLALPWLLAANAIAGGFSYSGEHYKLVNHTILYAGGLVEEKTQMERGVREPSWKASQTERLYSVGASCFYSNLNFSSHTAAMILVDKQGLVKTLAVFDTSGSEIVVRLHYVQLLNCNDIRNASEQKLLDETKAMIEEIERQAQRNQQLRRELEDQERKRKRQ